MEGRSKAYQILDRIASHVACGLLFFGLIFSWNAFSALRDAQIPVWPVAEGSLFLPVAMGIFFPPAFRRAMASLKAKSTPVADQTPPRTV